MRVPSARLFRVKGLAAVGLGIALGISALAATPALAARPARARAAQCTNPAAFRAVSAVTSADAWAVGNCWNGSEPRGLVERWNGRKWGTVAAPRAVEFYAGVAALTATDAWAVGGSSIIHWNGRRWASSPAPTQNAQLQAISAISASDIWAVGYLPKGQAQQTFVVQWNGKRWRRVPSPDPASGAGSANSLSSVAGDSPRNIWAVGQDSTTSGYTGLAMHWNGRRWNHVASPGVAGSSQTSLSGVAVAGSDVWAVGSAVVASENVSVILKWTGRSWLQVRSPNPGGSRGSDLSAVAASSPTSAFAVGSYGVGMLTAARTLIARWNGKTWRQVASPSPGGSNAEDLLFALAATPNSTWAVGCYTTGESNCGTLVERYARSRWSEVTSGPRP
jgi:hypothetical protein